VNTVSAFILLIEDDLELGRSTKALLQLVGYRVEWAATGEEVAQKIAAACYDVALLDLRLGKDDGALLIRDLRDAGHAIPPIIIVSAEPDERLRSSRTLARAEAVVSKPYSLTELNSALKRVLASAERR
jgi:two-component system, OmpR family, response regulator